MFALYPGGGVPSEGSNLLQYVTTAVYYARVKVGAS
jgi:hypothetical protein